MVRGSQGRRDGVSHGVPAGARNLGVRRSRVGKPAASAILPQGEYLRQHYSIVRYPVLTTANPRPLPSRSGASFTICHFSRADLSPHFHLDLQLRLAPPLIRSNS